MHTEISPDGIAPPAANYAHAMVSQAPTRWLHTSGVVPVGPEGEVPDAIADQAAVVWANIEAMLDEASFEVTDVVSVTTYAVDGEDLGPVMAARDATFGHHRCASTLVVVPRLAQPAWKVEIAVVASA